MQNKAVINIFISFKDNLFFKIIQTSSTFKVK